MQSKVYVFDNKGKSIDRYTIIFLETGEIFSVSDNPLCPRTGYNQFVDTSIEMEFPKEAPGWYDPEIGWWNTQFIDIANRALIYASKTNLRFGWPSSYVAMPDPVKKYITEKLERIATNEAARDKKLKTA